MDDETLDVAAPEIGQPAAEAVAETPSAEPSFGDGGTAPDEGQPAPRLYAGKYKSPEELEQSYLDSQREASRMAGELAAYRKSVAQPTPSADPIASKITQYESERGKWEQYAGREDLSWSERAKALSQVSRYDREIGALEAEARFTATSTKQGAAQVLEGEALAVFETYQQDLSPGSPLYAKAEQRYHQMVRAGYPEGVSTKADAVLWAAHHTGATKARVIQTDRKELLGTLNKAAKAAVRQGAGTATVVKSGGVTAKSIESMTDAEFSKYERSIQLGE